MANGPVLVVDFGAQYAQLIARRVREAGVYSELVPHSMPVDEILAKDPKAIILSGGPASVFEPGAPTIDTKVFESGVPVLGICYGFQVMAYELGGKVDKAALGEYGKTSATIDDAAGILADSPAEQTTWMSHGVAVEQAPAGFEVLAHTEGAPVAAMADESRKLYGVQWHPEVKHSPLGQKLIENFLHRCAALPNDWDASSIIEDQVKKIREQVGDAEVICGLSGGVDSAVAAALVHKAIGDQLTCVFVDQGEVEQVKHDFVAATGIRLITVDAADDFLDALAGVSEPERKRKIIGEKFIRTFEKAQRQVLEEAGARGKEVKFLVQGTLYPDVVESCALCSRMRCAPSAPSSVCPTKSSGVSPSRARVWASASSARSPRSASTCCARPTPSPARNSPRPVSTATSGSARSCFWLTFTLSASKATSAPTARRSSCARSARKTPTGPVSPMMCSPRSPRASPTNAARSTASSSIAPPSRRRPSNGSKPIGL